MWFKDNFDIIAEILRKTHAKSFKNMSFYYVRDYRKYGNILFHFEEKNMCKVKTPVISSNTFSLSAYKIVGTQFNPE